MSPPLDRMLQRQVDWLLDGPVRLQDGMLAAWADGGAPAYVYEEATGYLITLLCYLHRLTGHARYEVEAARTVRALRRAVGPRGGCGRGGVVYLFDTAVCLRALSCFFVSFPASEEARDGGPARALAGRLRETACAMACRRAACSPEPSGDDAKRWSLQFGAHQLKAISYLGASPGPWRELCGGLLESRYVGGRFVADSRKTRVYNHAHCYALEGLLMMPHTKADVVIAGAAFLAEVQAASGGIPRWSHTEGEDELAADATAQAVRIWLLSHAGRFKENIQRAAAFLSDMVGPGGGVRYSPDRSHENSWATIFAVQAQVWQDAGPDSVWLI